MFGDLKGHGFDLESSHLRHFMRLSRLTLLVVILYMWLITRGSQFIKWEQHRLVDWADRVDLSVFHIGLCMFGISPISSRSQYGGSLIFTKCQVTMVIIQ